MRRLIVAILILGLLFGSLPLNISGNTVSENPVEYWAICVGYGEDVGAEFNAAQQKYVLCKYGWKEENIKLVNDQATKQDLLNAFSWLNDSCDYNDVALLFINAHGGSGFFALKWNYFWYSEVDSELDKLNCGKIGVVVNTCFSGSAIPYISQDGRIIITCCGADQLGGLPLGQFLAAIEGYGDYFGDNDSRVSFEEVFDFLDRHQGSTLIDDRIPGELEFVNVEESDRIPDQISTFFLGGWINVNRKLSRAQSFVPSSNKINKLKIFLGRRGNPGPLNISIRKQLDGDDLTSVQVPQDFVIIGVYSKTAFDFYFPEIQVIPGETYYIVFKTVNPFVMYNEYLIEKTSYNEGYEEFDGYKNGNLFSKCVDEDWVSQPDDDFCFVTFYYDNFQPDKPVNLSGSASGSVGGLYNFSTFTKDPDGDEVYYWFDWGDGTYSGWLGPYKSGGNVTATHKWVNTGAFNISVKTKDVFGYVSLWSDPFTITIIDDTSPNVKIIKPLKGVYFQDKKILPRFIFLTLIIGDITVEVAASDNETGIEKVEFYAGLNGTKYLGNDTTAPYNFIWKRDHIRLIHIQILKVVAYDNVGNIASDRILVRKIL